MLTPLWLHSAVAVLLSTPLSTVQATPVPPTMEWFTCPSNISTSLKCTDILVPLDYGDPKSEEISLKLVKLPAKAENDRKGSIVWQLGGPGQITTELLVNTVSGVSDAFGELRNYFDIVTAEPRGISFNHPVKCDAEYGQRKPPYFPRSEEEYREATEFFGRMGANCANRTGKVIHHLDTRTQARDLEAVRRALGSDKLNYYGLSWGSQRGSQYAQLYPGNIRAMVLDGVVDHSLSPTAFTASESLSYDIAQRRMLEWMGQNSSSSLNGRNAIEIFPELIKRADRTPIQQPGCIESKECFPNVTGDDIRLQAVINVGQPILWPSFSRTIKQMNDDGNATALSYPIITEETGVTQSMLGIVCQDWQFPDTWKEYRALQYMNGAFSSLPQGAIGARMWPIGCAKWPTKVTNPTGSMKVENPSAPILLVNSLWDANTGYDQAVQVQAQIEKSVLITRYGEGHGSLEWPVTKKVMDEYFINLRIPEEDDRLVDTPVGPDETDFELLGWSKSKGT